MALEGFINSRYSDLAPVRCIAAKKFANTLQFASGDISACILQSVGIRNLTYQYMCHQQCEFHDRRPDVHVSKQGCNIASRNALCQG